MTPLHAIAFGISDLKNIGRKAGDAVHKIYDGAEELFISRAGTSCNNEFESIVWAGVPINKVFNTNAANPTCTSPLSLASCPLSTRIDVNDPDLKNNGGLLSRISQPPGSYVCASTNVVPTTFKRDLCSAANTAGNSSYSISTGSTFSRNASRSALNFRSVGDRCECAPRGYENIAGFLDCSTSNPHAGFNPPEDEEPEEENQEPQTEAERIAQEQADAQMAEQAEQCINERFDEVSRICDTAATALESTCSEQNPNNRGRAIAESAVNNFNQENQNSNSSQRDCSQSATMSIGAREGIQEMRNACNSALTSCQRQCIAEDVNNFAMACETFIGTRASSLALVDSKKTELQGRISAGLAKCNAAQAQISGYDTTIRSLAGSIRASAVCACQLATNNSLLAPRDGNSNSCTSLPSVEECSSRPLSPNCFNYNALATCSRGSSGFNEATCNCVQNSQLPGCDLILNTPIVTPANTLSAQNLGPTPLATSQAVTNGASGPSSFGGNLAVANGGGSAGGGGAGGSSSGGSSFDLNSGSGEASVASNLKLSGDGKTNNANAAGAAGGSSGGGAASGAAGSAGNGDVNAGENEESTTGLKGLFNKVVNAVGGLFGFGKKGNFKNGDLAAAKNNKVDFDANKFKPRKLRGLSSNEGDENGLVLGPKSMDIWKMMNMCVNGYRCKSNIDAYIKEPNPQ